MGKWVFVVVSAALFGVFASPAHADRDFTARFSTNDTGNIAIAGAPLMTCGTAAACVTAQGQTAANRPAGANTIATQNNNSYTMLNSNDDGDAATLVNGSTADLALPAGATVLYAAL